MCPAIVNLIELRFPSLVPSPGPVRLALEAVQAAHAERPVAYVVSCPSQRSALLAHEVAGGLLPGRATITEYVTPAQAPPGGHEEAGRPAGGRTPAATGGGNATAPPGRSAAHLPDAPMQAMAARLSCGGPQTPRLVVTGVDHVDGRAGGDRERAAGQT